MKKSPSACDKTEAFESQIDLNQNYQNGEKQGRKTKESEENSKNQEKTISMEQFCYQFGVNFFDKLNETISVQEMTKKYSVKNRRVYDLLGILEGLSFVCKLKAKGSYMWMGIYNNHYQFHFDEKNSVSLKDVAGLLKVLLNNCRQGLTIKDLNQKIIHKIEQSTKRQQCKRTITRRIYECLKIMKVFGMVQKHENLFKATFCKFRKPLHMSVGNQFQFSRDKIEPQGDISRMIGV